MSSRYNYHPVSGEKQFRETFFSHCLSEDLSEEASSDLLRSYDAGPSRPNEPRALASVSLGLPGDSYDNGKSHRDKRTSPDKLSRKWNPKRLACINPLSGNVYGDDFTAATVSQQSHDVAMIDSSKPEQEVTLEGHRFNVDRERLQNAEAEQQWSPDWPEELKEDLPSSRSWAPGRLICSSTRSKLDTNEESLQDGTDFSPFPRSTSEKARYQKPQIDTPGNDSNANEVNDTNSIPDQRKWHPNRLVCSTSSSNGDLMPVLSRQSRGRKKELWYVRPESTQSSENHVMDMVFFDKQGSIDMPHDL